jgi:hypothetical protein
MTTRDPETPAEWQAAIDMAASWLLVDSARQYGLITGGPVVDVVRCDQLLTAGRARGVVPITRGVDACLDAIMAGAGR